MSQPANEIPREYLELALSGLQSLPDAWIVFFDHDLRYVLAAGGGLARAGFDAAAIEGRLVSEVLPPDRARLWEPYYRGALDGQSFTFSLLGIKGDRWYEVSTTPWMSASGERMGGLSIGRDITDRKRIEDVNAAFAAVVAATDAAIIGSDLKGVITIWNGGAEGIFGYRADEAIGQPIAMLRPDDNADFDEAVARARAGENVQVDEAVRRRKDGTSVEVSVTVSPVRNDAGNVTGLGAVASDITRRKEAERERGLALTELEDAQRLARVGSWRRDLTTSKVTWSDQLYEIFGRDREAGPAFGEALLAYVHPEDRERVLNAVAGVPGAPPTFDLEFRIRTGRGDERIVHARGHPDPARPDTYFGTTQDVTDERQAEAERAGLLRASARAEAASRAKSEFLARMSHELRTPLNSILGFGQLLELDDLPDGQREYVEYILRGGRHLLQLINEVLDIASVESGRLSISPEPVALAELVQEAVTLVAPIARERQVTIDFDVSGLDGDDHAFADRNRLKQVLLNLLSNAIKYNRAGGRVAVSFAHADERVQIVITDTGIGIRPEQRANLFEPFERLGAEQIGIEGTGLGLALSKGLIEGMGGTIAVESETGLGSTFVVELAAADHPDRQDRTGAGGELAIEPRLQRPRQWRILYVEDNLSNLALVERVLRRHTAVELISAMQGSLGLELASKHHPDLVVLDVHLPDMSGIEVLKHLHAESPDVPVVVVTADATPRQAEALRRLGAAEYLTKPLDVRRFLAAINELLPAAIADSS